MHIKGIEVELTAYIAQLSCSCFFLTVSEEAQTFLREGGGDSTWYCTAYCSSHHYLSATLLWSGTDKASSTRGTFFER